MLFIYREGKIKSISYKVLQNVRVGSREYDIVATSKKDNIDLLYEVKYYFRGATNSLLDAAIARTQSMGADYETITHRNWRSILLIVIPDELYEKTINRCTSYCAEHPVSVEVKVIKESDLQKESNEKRAN